MWLSRGMPTTPKNLTSPFHTNLPALLPLFCPKNTLNRFCNFHAAFADFGENVYLYQGTPSGKPFPLTYR